MTDHSPTDPTDIAAKTGSELVMPVLESRAVEQSMSLDLGPVLDVPVELSVEIGRAIMTIRETLEIGPGSIVALNRMTGEPVDLLVNGHKIAQGEVVAIDEEFGLRITHVVSPERRLDAAA
jgi:flagellar motor switch protein FliN